MLDYGVAYADARARAFGTRPSERDALAYWPMDRWAVERLSGDRQEQFRACFDDAYWSSLPPIVGAIEACNALHAAGHSLICVSAVDSSFENARLRNLRTLGFPIEQVIATSATATFESPKAQALRALKPVAFVDDYLPYFRGVPGSTHKALVHRERVGSPNVGPELALVDTHHNKLQGFARWWLERDSNFRCE